MSTIYKNQELKIIGFFGAQNDGEICSKFLSQAP